jgi:hypothetical protein
VPEEPEGAVAGAPAPAPAMSLKDETAAINAKIQAAGPSKVQKEKTFMARFHLPRTASNKEKRRHDVKRTGVKVGEAHAVNAAVAEDQRNRNAKRRGPVGPVASLARSASRFFSSKKVLNSPTKV